MDAAVKCDCAEAEETHSILGLINTGRSCVCRVEGAVDETQQAAVNKHPEGRPFINLCLEETIGQTSFRSAWRYWD